VARATTGRCAVLFPLVAEAAHRVGAVAVGLVDVGCSAGLNLTVDRVRIAYGDGQVLGDPSSPVHHVCRLVGGGPVPQRSVPLVVTRIGVDRDPLDVTDAGDVRELRDGVPTDERDRLDAEIALLVQDPPVLLRGDPLDLLPEAIARVPAGALPVVMTTWALSRIPPARRPRLLDHLRRAGRSVAWVSAEGVGVAPGVPTFGDRPASGHSILGVAVADRSGLRVDAVGRCWQRGRVLAWLPGG
jgi:hypothetical protein